MTNQTRYAFILSQDLPTLAAQEVLALSKPKTKHKTFNNLLITNSKSIPHRLALTRSSHKVLFSCKPKNLTQKLDSFNWNKIYKESFSIKLLNLTTKSTRPTKLKETLLAKHIWRNVKTPKVNIKNAKTKIYIILTNSFIFVTLLEHKNPKDFQARHPKTLPAKHPTTLQPKIARAMVNLTGTTTTFTDPFCGAGGLLIESALMNLKTTGSDIENLMIKRAKLNLKHLNLKATLKQKDATQIINLTYIAADLPYGRNSSISDDTTVLYTKFLKQLKRHLKHKAVLIFPSFVNHRKLIKQAKLNILHQTTIYVHKSLSRNLVVLKK